MIPHRLNAKLLFLALLGIILYFTSGIVLSLSHNQSLEDDLSPPKITQAAAVETAERYAKERLGFQAVHWSTAYDTDKYTAGYVTKNALQDDYDKLYGDRLPLEYWLVIGRDADDRTLKLRVGMDRAEVSGWERSGSRAKVHDEKGTPVAMKALKDAGFNPDDFTYQPPVKKADANLFTFVSHKEAIGEAPMTVTVGIVQGEAASLRTGFQIPDSYMDWIRHQESLAGWMTGGFLLLTAAMGITALVLAIVHRGTVHWSRGILLTLIFLALYILQNLNVSDALLNGAGAGGADEKIANAFMVGFVVVVAALMAAAVWFSLLSGDQQWRMKGRALWTRWRDPDFGREVFYGMGRGYLICLFILGLQQIIFVAEANVFHSFGIPDPSQSPMNMKWPLLFPTAAWVAAIMEEAIYRMFGIILFKRILRYNFLALLVSSGVWALGHTAYTLYPSYTRLIEVTILGFVFGYTFLKFGFITAVFAHACMDSLLMALYTMTGDPTPVNLLTGLFYIVLPALIGYAVRFIHPRWGGPRRRPAPPPDPWGPPPDSRLTPQE